MMTLKWNVIIIVLVTTFPAPRTDEKKLDQNN